MIILNPILMHKTESGLYGRYADENLSELKRIMHDIILKEVDSSNRSYSWMLDKPKETAEASVQSSEGGRIWAKRTMIGSQKAPRVKTFAL